MFISREPFQITGNTVNTEVRFLVTRSKRETDPPRLFGARLARL
jgi:hypothetical protein